MKSVSENLLKINYGNVNQFDDCHCSKYKKQAAKATEVLTWIRAASKGISATCPMRKAIDEIASKTLKELSND